MLAAAVALLDGRSNALASMSGFDFYNFFTVRLQVVLRTGEADTDHGGSPFLHVNSVRRSSKNVRVLKANLSSLDHQTADGCWADGCDSERS